MVCLNIVGEGMREKINIDKVMMGEMTGNSIKAGLGRQDK